MATQIYVYTEVDRDCAVTDKTGKIGHLRNTLKIIT
jgi:hypothetical protein